MDSKLASSATLSCTFDPSSGAELVPGLLYALGSSISLDRRPGWMPADSKGWLPMQCYVLRDLETKSLVLIDTASTGQIDAIRAGLSTLAEGTMDRQLLLARREHDCTLNLPLLTREFAVDRVATAGDLNPLDYFSSMEESYSTALVTSQIQSRFFFLRPGNIIEAGRFRIEVLRAPLRVLSTSWFYEHHTKTLFTSDSWGLLTSPADGPPRAVTPSPAEITPESIANFMGTKFDWVKGIDTAPVIRELEDLLGGLEIDRLCPSYGLIIEGCDVVRQCIENAAEALALLARLPRPDALDTVDLEQLRRICS
ncbi:hypothetical protein [Roseomonas marmotae]|uniref:MBL fold metallo-hydrolase n=1 Tax=Roseomonas marmotae TaxID=2768161 RepID=A0ABS3KIQ4_9PROT|nr:hypothetical protein [Roseomonas marmotae]MBO1077350.1 hypothetical protein [Roseomonas marmotae]